MSEKERIGQIMKKPLYGELSVIGMKGCEEFVNQVDYYLNDWRRRDGQDTYLAKAECVRFGSGEAKGQIHASMRGQDVYIVCDVFNYVVADEQLLEVFLSIYTSIKSGGTLIFDVSSRAKLTDLVEQGQYVYDAEDVTYIWTNTISQDLVDMDITFFVKEGETYTRFDEYHTQRIYDKQHLLDMLKSCGYIDVECIDRGDRYYFIAKVRK